MTVSIPLALQVIAHTTLQGNKNVIKFTANNLISAGRVIISYDSVNTGHLDYTWTADGTTPIDGVTAANGVFKALGQAATGTWIYAFQSNVATDPVGNVSNFPVCFCQYDCFGCCIYD